MTYNPGMTTGISDTDYRHWSIGISADSISELDEKDSPDLGGLVQRSVEALSEWGELGDKSAAATNISALWRDSSAHPLALITLVLDKYGQEALEWHPDVLKLTLDKDGVALANSAWTKILAVRVLMLATSPWKRWSTFHWVARGLAGLSPNFTYLEDPEIWHLGLAVDCMKAVEPKRAVGLDVHKYVAATFASNGIRYAIPPLQFAQRELDEPRIKCMTCGALHRDDNDVKCISCGASSLKRLAPEFEQLRDQTKVWFDAHKNDTLDSLNPKLDSPVEQCGARLVLEHYQIRERRRALASQLRSIGKR